MLNVGLTGGVGSGKSTIAAMLARQGAGIVDADAISHQLTQPGGAAIPLLHGRFGAAAIAPDGSLDRDQMRTLAFSDTSARKDLESLLHPLIRAAMRERAAHLAATGYAYIVFVVPLLVESGSRPDYAGRVLLVDCSEATQFTRVCTRVGMDEATARAMIAAQATRQQRLALADDVLMNEGPLGDIERRAERLHQAYLQLSAGSESRETL
jgi:dephospho-CoA kinase